MSEQEPSIRLNLGNGEQLELTHDNTTLYTFLGRTAIGDTIFENASLNHTFIQLSDDEQGQARGMYLFEQFHPIYHDIAQFVLEHELPSVLNMRRLPECDLKSYMLESDRQAEAFAQSLEGVDPDDFKQ